MKEDAELSKLIEGIPCNFVKSVLLLFCVFSQCKTPYCSKYNVTKVSLYIVGDIVGLTVSVSLQYAGTPGH